jgi:hypothetical protein
MRRASKFLCGFGAIGVLCAGLAIYIFEHVPFPWGVGTLPGGLSDAGASDPFGQAIEWQVRTVAGILGGGFVAALYFLAGCVCYAISRVASRRSRLH